LSLSRNRMMDDGKRSTLNPMLYQNPGIVSQWDCYWESL